MQYGKGNKPNLNIDDSKSFTQELKQVDTTRINKIISKIRVSVPDLEDYSNRRFSIGEYDLETPLICRIESNNNHMLRRMRQIKMPEYQEYKYQMRPFNDYLPFVENMVERPHGEFFYRNQTLTPLNKMPKISIEFDEKINMKKW